MFLIFILPYIALCAAQCVPEELTIKNSEGGLIPLNAYISHEEFFTDILQSLGHKIRAATESILGYSKINTNQLLLNINSKQYLFLQMINSLASKDVVFTNQLLEQASEKNINRKTISNEWMRTHIKLPLVKMYAVIESIVNGQNIGLSKIPEEIIEEILLMTNKTEIFYKSCEKGDAKISQWLLNRGDGLDLISAVEIAWEYGKWEIVKILIRNGAFKNIKGDKIKKMISANLLHLTLAGNSPEAVSTLLKAGAPIDAVDVMGRSPLDIAIENNDTDAVRILLENKAEIDKTGIRGNTALHTAASRGNVEAVKLLLKYAGSIHDKNILGLTPLNIADQSGIFYIIEYLIHENIRLPNTITSERDFLPYMYFFNENMGPINDHVNIENYCEVTRIMNSRSHHVPFEMDLKSKLLDLVIKNRIPPLVQCLINLGADLSSINRNNETMLFNAVRADSSEIVRLLINEGIDVEAMDVNGTTALHVAAGNGLVDVVSMLLKRGADINAVTKEGFTSLHKAAKSGHVEVVDFLLDKNINVSSTMNSEGRVQETPLQLAASHGHLIVVKSLLNRGVFNDTKANETWNTLHAAAKAGHNDIVNFLLDSGFNVNVADEKGRTPLYWAAYGGSVLTVLSLLESKADINTRSNHEVVGNKFAIFLKNHETPLHVAALNGHLEICQILIGKGIDKDVKDALHETPLYNAALQGHYAVTKFLLEQKAFKNGRNSAGYTALHAAAEKGHNDIIDLLYDKGMDIEVETIHGQTPLHIACKSGLLSTVKNLIDKLANVNAESTYGTPLTVAVRNGHTDIVFHLLENGAKIEVIDNQGNTLLMDAVKRGQKDLVILLMKRGASSNSPSKRSDGKTPLHLAAKDDPEMVKLLLEKRAFKNTQAADGTTALFEAIDWNNIETAKLLVYKYVINNTRKGDGWSCLHLAVVRGAADLVKMLVEEEANVNALDAKNNTPLHFSAYKNEFEITKILLDSGANVNIKNYEGETPLDIAIKNNSTKILNLRLCDCKL